MFYEFEYLVWDNVYTYCHVITQTLIVRLILLMWFFFLFFHMFLFV